ncbi:MAG: response regulator [Candidatus Sericytochromatia bacterium]|nr:response regulator [Candidatus Sericytochromatia bacterium]
MTGPPAPAKVLLVDDDPRQVEGLAGRLERHGFLPFVLRDGKALAAWLGSEPADLIVLDQQLPEENGLSVYRKLKQEGLLHEGTPVVLLSGLLESQDIVAAFDEGIWDIVAKPADPLALVARLRAILHRSRRLRDALEQAGLKR